MQEFKRDELMICWDADGATGQLTQGYQYTCINWSPGVFTGQNKVRVLTDDGRLKWFAAKRFCKPSEYRI